MRSADDCIAQVAAASGRDAADPELEAIFDELQARARARMAKGQGSGDAARDAGVELARETKLAAMVKKRESAIVAVRVRERRADIIPGKEAESFRSMLTGIRGADRNAGFSADATSLALLTERVGHLMSDLEESGLLKVFRRSDLAFDRDITREMWRLKDPESGTPTGNKIAVQMARILEKHLEIARVGENDAGAWIGKREHYVGRQSHDMDKIRGDGLDADYRAWRDYILPRLDPEETFAHLRTPADAEAFLHATWQSLASGVHEGAKGSTWLAGFQGPGNLAKKLSQERKLHFKDADAYFEYNARFGRGNIRDTITRSIESAARNTAIMEKFGPNPGALIEGLRTYLIAKAKRENDFQTIDALQNGRKETEALLDYVSRKTSSIEHNTLARVGIVARQVIDMGMLGGAGISSLTDAAAVAAAARHGGVPLWKGYFDYIRELLGPNSPERRGVLRSVGVGVSAIQGDIASRLHATDAVSGGLSKATTLFHRLSGLEYITNAGKGAEGLALSNHLAQSSGLGYGALEPRLQGTLRRYGIEEPEWNAIRQAEQRAADGEVYLLPAEIRGMPDSAVAHLVKEGAAPRDFARVKTELSRKLMTYYGDMIREALSEPTAAGRIGMTMSTAPGTPMGEIVRTIMQFKSFFTTFTARSLGRELFRDGVDVGGTAHLIAGTTVLGLGVMTIKNLLAGRNPREPETAGDWARFGAAGLLQGGGLGIFGDFLFSEYNRHGKGFVGSLAGPGAGVISDVASLIGSIRSGTGHPGAEALKTARSLTPFVNLAYTRGILDYLVFYRLQEWLNPGYLRRYEAWVKKENDQTFWLRPTQYFGR